MLRLRPMAQPYRTLDAVIALDGADVPALVVSVDDNASISR
jgi:hypothetical protein